MQKVNRKSMAIRFSGRSSDFISPSFGHGCLYKCSYCYMRRHKPTGLSIAKNTGTILTAINNHALKEQLLQTVSKPNQTDSQFITYDISCNEDFALHHKYHDWQRIFQFFKDHQTAKATFATKFIPAKFLDFNPERKVRIRFSLMPQVYSDILEPNTTKIVDRIKAINTFYQAGYDVHINFSPVIWHLDGRELYRELFELLDNLVDDNIKKQVKAEVIFLTHNVKMHNSNDEKSEELLWSPKVQETKVSQYGGNNLRYKYKVKKTYIDKFKELHDSIIDWNEIRYIF